MCSILPWVLDDETLASFILQSTWQKEKGSTKIEDPMFNFLCGAPKMGAPYFPTLSHCPTLIAPPCKTKFSITCILALWISQYTVQIGTFFPIPCNAHQ